MNNSTYSHIIARKGFDNHKHEYLINHPIYQDVSSKYDAVVCVDGEWQEESNCPQEYSSYDSYKKFINTLKFVGLSLYNPSTNMLKIYEHPSLKLGLAPTWKNECVLSTELGLEELPINNHLTDDSLKLGKPFVVGLEMYFSGYDIFVMFKSRHRWNYIARQMCGGRVIHGNDFQPLKTDLYIKGINSKGEECKREIHIQPIDLKGYQPAGLPGLDNLFKSQSIPFENKGLKKHFQIAKFVDELQNETIVEEYNNKMVKDIAMEYWMEDGTEKLFEFLIKIHDNMSETLKTINPDYTVKYSLTIGSFANQHGVASLLKQFNLPDDDEGRYQLASMLYLSSGYLWAKSNDTNQLLISSEGGMCKNLSPTEHFHDELCVDQDWKSAYPSIMKGIPYCVGSLAIVSFNTKEVERGREKFDNQRTLKVIFNEYEDRLVDDCWKMSISTKPNHRYSFRQDLLSSVVIGESFYDGNFDDEDFEDIKGSGGINELVQKGGVTYSTRQVINCELTSIHLEVMKKYWKRSELKEFFENTLVNAFCFYDAKSELSNEDFLEKFIDGDVTDYAVKKKNVKGKNITIDENRHYWTRMNTNEKWFGLMADKRNEYKSLMKNAPKGSEEKVKYNSIQNGFKTINNGSNGVTMSAFYHTEQPKMKKTKKSVSYSSNPKIGNVIFGANVTAKMRVASWCLAKTCNGKIVITDGTPTLINKTKRWDWRNDKYRKYLGSDGLVEIGLHKKTEDMDTKLVCEFNIETYPLGDNGLWEKVDEYTDEKSNKLITVYANDVEKTECSYENAPRFTELQLEAVKNQFSELSIFQNDDLQLDAKDVYQSLTVASQANYLLKNRDGSDMIKARGYQTKKPCYLSPDLQGGFIEHPYNDMFRLVSEGKGNPYVETTYQSDLLGANDYKKTHKSWIRYQKRRMLPFGSSSRSTKPNPLSMSMFWYSDWQQRQFWDKLNTSTKNYTGGFGLEILIMTPEEMMNMSYYDYPKLIVLIQKMIDDLDYKNSKDVESTLEEYKERVQQVRDTFLLNLKNSNVVHPDVIYRKSFDSKIIIK